MRPPAALGFVKRLCDPAWLRTLVPADYPRAPGPRLEQLGIACLLLAVFLTPWARDWARVFEVLLVLMTILSARQIVRHDPDAWIYAGLVLFVAWMLLSNHLAAKAFPEWTGDKLEGTRDGARLFIFAFCGWWMGARRQGIVRLAWIALAGVVVASLTHVIGTELLGMSADKRAAFGFRNSQHAAVVYGGLLLAIIVLSVRWCRLGQRARSPVYRIAACVAAIAGLLWLLEQTGNRQIWLGLVAGLGVAGVLALRSARPRDRAVRARLLRPGTGWAVVLVAVIGVAWSAGPAWDRLEREWGAVTAYLSGEVESPQLSSATIRLLLWRHALEVTAERPLLGHGGASRQHLIRASDLPATVKRRFGHVHNSYLDLATAYGILAPLIFVVILGGLGARVVQAWRHAWLPTDVAALLLGWLALFAVVNVFESYVNYDTGLFLMMVIGGAAYSATLPYRRQRSGRSGLREPAG